MAYVRDNGQPPNLQAVQQAYQAGWIRGPFWYKQGRSSVNIVNDGAFLEAGDGHNRAMAFVPRRTELVYVDREVPVQTRTPVGKSKRTCCIVLLVLVILAIIAAIVIGVFIYEANKDG